MRKIPLLLSVFSLLGAVAFATPSTQIWIPSTDIQPFGVPHFGLDGYFRASGHGYYEAGQRDPNMFDSGLTIGVLPFQAVQMEVGVDYLSTFSGLPTDDHPIFFNAKLGTPENTLFTNAPALAVGGYNFGTKSHDTARTDQNIIYGLASKTLPEICCLPSIGRVSAGWYVGRDVVLTGPGGSLGNNHGLLLSWDRAMSELDDRLWLGVDYMGGNNVNGGLSFGVGWSFTSNISLIVGYDLWNKKSVAGANTITTQLDVNF